MGAVGAHKLAPSAECDSVYGTSFALWIASHRKGAVGMPTLAQLQNNTVNQTPAPETRFSSEEVLISDTRNRMRSADIIERKLQAALEVPRGASLDRFDLRR